MESIINFLKELPGLLKYGGTVMVIGLATVFLGLAILIGFIYVLSAALNGSGKKPAEAPKAAAPAPAPVVVPQAVAQAAATPDTSADELVAVITAALMAYTAGDKSATAGKTLVVRNIRAARANSWAQAGRTAQVNSRF